MWRIIDKLTVIITILSYVVGKLFSKVEHIELPALCVYFKCFIAKNYTATEDKFI